MRKCTGTHLTMSSEWMPDGVSMTVRLLLRHRGFLQSSCRPHASTAARVAVASLRVSRVTQVWSVVRLAILCWPEAVCARQPGVGRQRHATAKETLKSCDSAREGLNAASVWFASCT